MFEEEEKRMYEEEEKRMFEEEEKMANVKMYSYPFIPTA